MCFVLFLMMLVMLWQSVMSYLVLPDLIHFIVPSDITETYTWNLYLIEVSQALQYVPNLVKIIQLAFITKSVWDCFNLKFDTEAILANKKSHVVHRDTNIYI